ncbi:MAG: ATP-binding protein [Oscillospiraceae bacterium]|jgi:predicted AAA+ superfamily ATPase|nr:ATP-binding protein [Oscillospiraceae bacterium]
MRYIKRSMEDIVLRLSGQYPALLLTGPRQTGKTTMLQKLMAEEGGRRAYVTLDAWEERRLAKSDPAMFFQLHRPPLLIDEVQYAPELFTYIKIHIDKNHNPGDFWMTGSQAFKLMRGVRESLAGRVALLRMSPLSQREIAGGGEAAPFALDVEALTARQALTAPVAAPQMYERVWKGGMPALVSGRYTDQEVFYANYLETYLNRDVRALSAAIDSLKFTNFITAAAARTGGLLNVKSIADDADIDQSTAKNWLNILETLGIVFYLHPYSNNVLKRTVKAPKLYFCDTGLVCCLSKWSSPETAMNGAMNGALLENYVVSEIVKSYQNNALEPRLYYYRDRDAKEIDLLLESDGQLYPMEIKKTASPDKRLTRVFGAIDKSPLRRGAGAVLCMAEQLGAFDRENLIVPIWLI